MRKLSFLALVLAMCLCLGACSSGEAPSVPEEPTTAVPEYSFINSDRYVQNGTTGIGYRVAIGDGATEEEMRAVFGELCSADSYDLHTVWFYGLPSDVEDVGSFSVGMLEEKSRGAEPVFTPCTYDADTIAALRERGAEIEQSDEARSIPHPSIQQEALVEENRFYPVDGVIFTTAADENGLVEYGALYISAVSVNIPEIDEGAEITVYFVYSGFSDALGGPCGVYAYYE